MGEVTSATTTVKTTATTSHRHPSPGQPATETRFRWLLAITFFFTFITCFLRDFVLPHVPVMSWADQILFASDRPRILAGQMPSLTYLQFLPHPSHLPH